MITLWHFLGVGAVLFALGLVGFLTRRNLITMFLCAEMMLQGVAINFAAFARYHGNLHGQVFVLFIVAVAACEAGVLIWDVRDPEAPAHLRNGLPCPDVQTSAARRMRDSLGAPAKREAQRRLA